MANLSLTEQIWGCTAMTMPDIHWISWHFCSITSCKCMFRTVLFWNSLTFGNIVNAQALKYLHAVIKNCRHLKSIKFERCGVLEVLEQAPNPDACSLKIGFIWPVRHSCSLTSAGAERLAGVSPQFTNITCLDLLVVDCCAVAVNKLVSSITHKTLQELKLSDINLTLAAVAAFGRSRRPYEHSC